MKGKGPLFPKRKKDAKESYLQKEFPLKGKFGQ